MPDRTSERAESPTCITETESPAVNRTYVTTFDADGEIVKSIELQGLPSYGSYRVGENGTVYMTTFKTGPGNIPNRTIINFVDADGVVHPVTVHRTPNFDGFAVDPDGTVYQLTIERRSDVWLRPSMPMASSTKVRR